MLHHKNWLLRLLALAVLCALIGSCGFKRKKYENPITKDTQQPDKVLFDKAINDMERSRYEVARLTLQTLMNTYDTSEYLAKAKLAYADSWFREGGTHGLAQAEAEYKDFILFYPTLEESAEAQEKVCMIHYRQMEKADRDMSHALRAEDECRNLLVQFPNSKFAPQAQQRLREIQEVIAEGEMRRGTFLSHQGQQSRRRKPPASPDRSVPPLQQRRRSEYAAGRFLFEDGHALPPEERRGVCPCGSRVPAKPLRGRRKEETADLGNTYSRGGSGGLRPHEVRA